MNPRLSRKSTLAAFLLVSLIGAFYLTTIREGHVWGDDQAAYIAHARNITMGTPYGDIGYLRSPTSINPAMYPPGFPLLLAPVYHFYGLNLRPMKVLCIASFCAALCLFYFLVRDRDEPQTALLAVALTGLCPYFWDLKDSVISDYPFMALAYATLLVARYHIGRRDPGRSQFVWGVAAGLLAGAAYSTRSVGLLFVPIIVLCDFLALRRLSLFSVATALAFLGVAVIQKLVLPADSDYLTAYRQFVTLRSLLGSPLYYVKCFSVLWENGYSMAGQYLLYVPLAALTLYSAALRFRAGMCAWRNSPEGPAAAPPSSLEVGSRSVCEPPLAEVFVVAYFLFICLFPWGGRRYLLPVMPFFFFYMVFGGRCLLRQRSRTVRVVLGTGFAVLIGACFLARFSTFDWRKIPGGIQTDEAQDMVRFVQTNIGNHGLAVFHKPRFLALHALTRGTDVFCTRKLDEALQYYRTVAASHVIRAKNADNEDERSLDELVTERPEHFVKIHENDNFCVYRFE